MERSKITPEMSKRRLQALADRIEGEGEARFSMNSWLSIERDSCGYAACIGGHATLMMMEDRLGKEVVRSNIYRAIEDGDCYGVIEMAEYLGITKRQADRLFLPFPMTPEDIGKMEYSPGVLQEGDWNWIANEGSRGYITHEHAASVVRNLAETGVVDWEGQRP